MTRRCPFKAFPLLDSWTPEKAWWCGILWGDGNVFQRRKNWRVSACGSLSTMTRWLALIAPGRAPKEFKRSPGTYQAYVDSALLVELVEAEFGICGPKAASLVWPEALPEGLKVHFLRGLWDSDGCLSIATRTRKGWTPECKLSYGSICESFVVRVRDELVQVAGMRCAAICRQTHPTSDTWTVSYGCATALRLADYLYADAPEHLRNEDRYEVYQRMCAIRDQLLEGCHSCGKTCKKYRDSLCDKCWWGRRTEERRQLCSRCQVKWAKTKELCTGCYSQHLRSQPEYVRPSNGVCACGKPSYRRGLCDACYSRERRQKQARQRAEAKSVVVRA